MMLWCWRKLSEDISTWHRTRLLGGKTAVNVTGAGSNRTNHTAWAMTSTVVIRKLPVLLELPDSRCRTKWHKNAVRYELFKLLLRSKIGNWRGPLCLCGATDHISCSSSPNPFPPAPKHCRKAKRIQHTTIELDTSPFYGPNTKVLRMYFNRLLLILKLRYFGGP